MFVVVLSVAGRLAVRAMESGVPLVEPGVENSVMKRK